MTDSRTLAEAVSNAPAKLAALLRRYAEPLLSPLEREAFGAFFDRFGDAQIILLGEATHGTSEFYQARTAITRRLIEHHGFTVVAVEADWPDAPRIDGSGRAGRAVRNGPRA